MCTDPSATKDKAKWRIRGAVDRISFGASSSRRRSRETSVRIPEGRDRAQAEDL